MAAYFNDSIDTELYKICEDMDTCSIFDDGYNEELSNICRQTEINVIQQADSRKRTISTDNNIHNLKRVKSEASTSMDIDKLLPDKRIDYPGGRYIIRNAFSRRRVPKSSLEIMLASLAPNSMNQYEVYLKRWWNFCQNSNVNVYEASITTVIYFLTQLFNDGYQYSSINSCRSALSLVLGPALANDDRLKRFLKGIYRLKPPKPKYNVICDINLVLEKLSSWYPNEELSLEKLSYKTITLLAISTAQRAQTFSKININYIQSFSQRISIKIIDFLKICKPGTQQSLIHLPFFLEKIAICPATTLLSYIERTSTLRACDSLFLGYRKPHKAVSTQTLSRWIKSTLGECGVDTSVFSAHRLG